MRKVILVVLALSFSVVACGGDSDPIFYDADTTDSRPVVDAPAAGCLISGTFADMTIGTAASPFVGNVAGTAGTFSAGVYTEPAAMQGFAVFMAEGMGAFAGGFATGTFNDTTTCGACMQLFAGYTMPNLSDATQIYQATTSSVDVTTFTNPAAAVGTTSRIEGVFSSVDFQGFDAASQQAIANCTPTVTNLSFVWDITWTN